VVVAKVYPYQIVDFLRDYHKEHGYPPSIREMADHFGIGVSTTHRHLQHLIVQREVIAQAGRSRTWRVP